MNIDLIIYCALKSLIEIRTSMKNKEIPCTDERKKTIDNAIKELYALQLIRLYYGDSCEEVEKVETEKKPAPKNEGE